MTVIGPMTCIGPMRVIGLMSGTSVDGVDAAVVEIHGTPPSLNVALLSFTRLPFDADQRARIFGLFEQGPQGLEPNLVLLFFLHRGVDLELSLEVPR